MNSTCNELSHAATICRRREEKKRGEGGREGGGCFHVKSGRMTPLDRVTRLVMALATPVFVLVVVWAAARWSGASHPER